MRRILMEGDRGWMESTRITARPIGGTSTPLSAAVCACHGCSSGWTALLIRLAITGRRGELADKERRQAAIAHLHARLSGIPDSARRMRIATSRA